MIATANRIQELEPVIMPFEPLPAERSREKFFTLDGDGALEMHIERTCKCVLAGVQKIILPQQLEGLLLGGGYGRGEGGVLRTKNGDRPYNDFEFYVLIRGNDWLNEKIYGRRLHRLAKSLTPEAGAEIEFKIISRQTLSQSPASMFFYDLISAHRWLLGDENMLTGCEHHRHAGDIPPAEATRLLMNRCSGLLFSKEKLESKSFDDTDADFVSRNVAKVQLALGDAVLTVFGQYHWSALVRNHRLLEFEPEENLPWLRAIRHQHEDGLKFKLHPQITLSRMALQMEHEKISALAQQVWLWLENRRLDCHFLSMRGYALSTLDKCPETAARRNKLVNAKIFGFHAWFKTRSEHHPRERVLDALAILLWLPWREKDDLRQCLEKQLKRDMSVGESFEWAIVKAFELFSRLPVIGKFFGGFKFVSRPFNYMAAYKKIWSEVK
jgi:hypothetical protein